MTQNIFRQRNYSQLFTNRSSAAELLHNRQKAFPLSVTVLYSLLHIRSSTADLFLLVLQNDPLPRKCRLRSWWLSTHPTEFPRFGTKVEHGGNVLFCPDMVTGALKEPDSPLQMPYPTRIRQNPPSERKVIHSPEKLQKSYKRRQKSSNKSPRSRRTKRRRYIVEWTV